MLDQVENLERKYHDKSVSTVSQWEESAQLVWDILTESYKIWSTEISHYQPPDRSHGHSPTYFLEINQDTQTRFSCKSWMFHVFLDLLQYDQTVFKPSKSAQRYMKDLCKYLWESNITHIAWVWYYIWDTSTIDRDEFVDRYILDNLEPLELDVSFVYKWVTYTCLWFSRQNWPRRYRFTRIWANSSDNDFWVTYRDFDTISKGDSSILPPRWVCKILDEILKDISLFSWYIGPYQYRETKDHHITNNNGTLHFLKISSDSHEEEREVRWVVLSLLKKVIEAEWNIFVPGKAESIYMKDIKALLPINYFHHIRGTGYYIWPIPNKWELEEAKIRLRMKSLTSLKRRVSFNADGANIVCKWISKQRAGDTYYFESSDGKVITLSWTCFDLLLKLMKQPWEIVKTTRADKSSIEWIRKAFGKDFVKSIPGKWVYMYDLSSREAEWIEREKRLAELTRKEESEKRKEEKVKALKRSQDIKKRRKTVIASRRLRISKQEEQERQELIRIQELQKRESLSALSFQSSSVSIRAINNFEIVINNTYRLEPPLEAYELIHDLCKLWEVWKVKKLNTREEKAYKAFLESIPDDCPKFIDEIDAPWVVISIWDNEYVKKYNSIFSTAN